MKIVKKSGHIEDFSITKIILSIENSAKDINILLSKSDINIITKDVVKILRKISKNNITSTYEITGIVIQVLKDNKFYRIAESYIF